MNYMKRAADQAVLAKEALNIIDPQDTEGMVIAVTLQAIARALLAIHYDLERLAQG